ncbi:MAG: Hsp33 family molecular chaperone HslO [Eubacterium sp.]|nr:Hsp33 family molecular chaperone HslO [Eubacterium sp.]
MDYIVRATAAGGQIRAFAANTHDMVERARTIHDTTPVASAALGRLLTAGAMMGIMMKGDRDLLSITIKGDGPIGGLTVTADAHGNVKGFPYNPDVPVLISKKHKLDVGAALGNGVLTVVKDLGLKEPYSGQIDLQSGEIGDDLAYYFMISEQIPSSVGVGVLVDTDDSILQAGGFIIQLMPDAEEETIAQLEKNLTGVHSVTVMLTEGLSPEQILEKLLGNLGLEINETLPARYQCNCSRERVTKALISLGEKELRSLAEEGKPVTLHCDFCKSDYTFEVDEIRALLPA